MAVPFLGYESIAIQMPALPEDQILANQQTLLDAVNRQTEMLNKHSVVIKDLADQAADQAIQLRWSREAAHTVQDEVQRLRKDIKAMTKAIKALLPETGL